MLRSWTDRFVSVARAQGWWIGPQLIVVVALSVTVGLWGVWAVYAIANSVGVWLYADHHGSRKLGRQKVLKALSILLLPVGFLGVVTTGGGPTIGEKAGPASDDPGVREATASASGRFTSGMGL